VSPKLPYWTGSLSLLYALLGTRRVPGAMEVVLSSLIEWIEKRFEKHTVVKLFLVLLTFLFGFWLAYMEWKSRGLL
jgi:hypothetical protein